MIKNVTVFCAAHPHGEKGQHYLDLAYNFGKRLAEEGFTCVNGGNWGMMSALSKGAHEAGGVVHCVTLHAEKYPIDHSSYTHLENHVELTARQSRLFTLADAFVALPGGIGTHFEIFEVLAKKNIEEITDEKLLICVGEEYDVLAELITNMVNRGLAYGDPLSHIKFARNIDEAIEMLKACSTTPVPAA